MTPAPRLSTTFSDSWCFGIVELPAGIQLRAARLFLRALAQADPTEAQLGEVHLEDLVDYLLEGHTRPGGELSPEGIDQATAWAEAFEAAGARLRRAALQSAA